LGKSIQPTSTKTGLETGPLSLSRKIITDLEGKLATARAELSEFADDVGHLEVALGRRASLIKPELRASLELEFDQAQAAAALLARADSDIQDALRSKEQARILLSHSQQLLGQRKLQADDVADLRHRAQHSDGFPQFARKPKLKNAERRSTTA